ncbi:MAG: WG repeat-containing protein [Bacteroides sp.]|nr:WG repeat-containing protein [Bacteroides sp.]
MKIKTILGLLALTILNSCSSEDQPYKYQLEYISFENEDSNDDEYGFLGRNGVAFPKSFDKEVGSVINGYFAIEDEDGYTICKITDDSYEKVPNTSGYYNVGIMNDGLIPVCKEDNNIQVLDGDGNVKFSLAQVDSIDVWDCFSYSCGKMRVQLNNEKYVYVDTEGRNAFNKSYDWATDFDNGYAVVGIGNDKYQLINLDGESILSFVCDDSQEIVISSKYKKLSAKDDSDRYTIYSFDGKYTVLPKMVEGIYALLENEFIFKSDSNYGLMSYDDCRDKIYAKYDQLVPNGKYYLGIPTDNDNVVKLLDSDGTELGTFDGYEILSPIKLGFNFPNIIKRPDDRIFLVDAKGQMIGRAENFEFDIDDIKKASQVHNMYFPIEHIDNTILGLCGDGKGVPNGEGAFFLKDGSHCHTYEIKYFNNASDLEQFKGKYLDEHLIEQGVNYHISLSYKFDEPIVRTTADSLNRSAWLNYILVEVSTTNWLYEITTYNRIKALLKERGCTELFSNNRGVVLRSFNSDNLIIFQHSDSNNFTIRMSKYSYETADLWKTYLTNKK